jgi:UDP-N-acetylmuramyl pentapeptide phosphotransferase/UDP-N-acetylglucosamine-1-phosphate transferase
MDNYILLIYKVLFSLILIGLLNGLLDKIISFVGAYDNPGPRKIHKLTVPLIGGVLIYCYLIVTCLLYFLVFKDNLLLELNIFSFKNLIFLNLIIFLVFFIGIIDDKFELTNIRKLFLLSIIIFLICYQDKTLIPVNFEFSFNWNIAVNNLSRIVIFLINYSFYHFNEFI